jgi:hypothetical protein
MIKVNLNDILNASGTFNAIMQQSFKGSLAFKIARLARELSKEMETFNAERQKLLQKYCMKDENGELKTNDNGTVQVEPDKINEFNEEFSSLLETEVEINAEKLSMDSLDSFDITPQQMISIEKFFEE